MPLTRFERFVITYEGAATEESGGGQDERVYRLVEAPQGRWSLTEDGRAVAMDGEQRVWLAQLLGALDPWPEPLAQQAAHGSDGTWVAVELRRGAEWRAYRWWMWPPPGLERIGAVADLARQLADAPREREREQQRQVTRRLFGHLAARELEGALTCYHPDARYSSPVFELRGAEVGAMWRMAWSTLPDLRVSCGDSDVRAGFAYWRAAYTSPPTGRLVEQQLTADLTFAGGLVVRHVDRFNLHEWAGRAYGAVGGALGGQRLFQRWVARRARARLALFVRADVPLE